MTQPPDVFNATRLIVRRMHRLAADARMIGDMQAATTIAAMADLLSLQTRLGVLPRAAVRDPLPLAA